MIGHENGRGAGASQHYNSPKNDLPQDPLRNAAANSTSDDHNRSPEFDARGHASYDGRRVPRKITDRDYQQALNDQFYEESKYSKRAQQETASRKAQGKLAPITGSRGTKQLLEQTADDSAYKRMTRQKVSHPDDGREHATGEHGDSNVTPKPVASMGSIPRDSPHNHDRKEHSRDYIERLPQAMGNVLERGR